MSPDVPPEGAVLDRRTLNRTLLARQGLLERVEMTPAAMVERLVGLQAQVPRDPYVALWSRLRTFDPAELERLLLGRQAVRMTLMRTTLHLVTARDARPLRAATQAVCERAFRSSAFARRLEGLDLDAVAAFGGELLAERPRTIAELGRELAESWAGSDPEALAYAVRFFVPLVQVPPRGLLRRSAAARATTLDAWLGPAAVAGDDGTTGGAIDEVVLRYLRAFGPATASDVRTWSWLTNVRAALDRLRPRLRTYRDEAGRELFDVADGEFAAPDRPAPVRFTGEFDNLFLSHADRSRVTGDSAWGMSYGRRGAFFVDGFLAGAWRLVADGGAMLSLEPRVPLRSSDRDAVVAEAEELARFLAPDAGAARIDWVAEGDAA